jgi:toxin YoeB
VTIAFEKNGWEDYCSWADDRKTLRRINRMIDEAARDPSAGIAKPVPLSHNLAGYWSRRITQEDRLVYQVKGDTLIIIQAGRHY